MTKKPKSSDGKGETLQRPEKTLDKAAVARGNTAYQEEKRIREEKEKPMAKAPKDKGEDGKELRREREQARKDATSGAQTAAALRAKQADLTRLLDPPADEDDDLD